MQAEGYNSRNIKYMEWYNKNRDENKDGHQKHLGLRDGSVECKAECRRMFTIAKRYFKKVQRDSEKWSPDKLWS